MTPPTRPQEAVAVSVVGDQAEQAVRSACEHVEAAGPDDRIDGVEPALVAHPRSTEEVAEVMRAAAAHELSVVPRGRGTKLTWGLAPRSADLVVDVSALDRVLDHQAGDLVMHTQAGARLADVQASLAQQGQRLVVDETVPGASIGGTLAVNASGPERLAVGTVRDLLLGVTVVRADGVVAKAGGRVVKNVAGYDIGKLVVGSFGTLAVVTEALFRLHPEPAARRWVGVQVDGPARAHELARAVVNAQAVPAAVEVDLPADGPGTVTVLLTGREDGVEARAATVAALLGADADVTDLPPDCWAAYPWGSGETGLKLTCVLSGLSDVLTRARARGAHVRGSAGAGVLYAALPDASSAPEALADLRDACTRHQGSAVVVDAPVEVKDALDVWGPVPALDLMQRVKDQFDPAHRLAPGRFVGGI